MRPFPACILSISMLRPSLRPSLARIAILSLVPRPWVVPGQDCGALVLVVPGLGRGVLALDVLVLVLFAPLENSCQKCQRRNCPASFSSAPWCVDALFGSVNFLARESVFLLVQFFPVRGGTTVRPYRGLYRTVPLTPTDNAKRYRGTCTGTCTVCTPNHRYRLIGPIHCL